MSTDSTPDQAVVVPPAGRLHDRTRSMLVVIDVQEKLVPAVIDADRMIDRLRFIIAVAEALEVPIVVSEQYPKGLGPTIDGLFTDSPAVTFEKTRFSAANCDELKRSLANFDRDSIVLAGIETHVCVMQSALELIAAGKTPTLAIDATSSRAVDDRDTAFRRMRAAGVVEATTEMLAFEWLRDAADEKFRTIQSMIKVRRAV